MQWLLNKKIDISVLRSVEVVTESDHLQQRRTSALIEAANLAVEGSACGTFANETEKDEFSHDTTGNSTPNHYTAHSISNIRLGSTDTKVCRFIERCIECGGRKCTVKYTHYHCTLCPSCKYFPSLHHITRRIQQTHVNPAKTFEYDGSLVLPCKQEHYTGSIGYPVYVQKIIHDSTSTSIDCGDLNCKLELQLASRAKMKGHECRHSLHVNNASYPTQITLLKSRSLELEQENHIIVLKNETITKCI